MDLPVIQLTELQDQLKDVRAMVEVVSERQDALLSNLQTLANRVSTLEGIGSLWETYECRVQAIENFTLAAAIPSVVAELDDLADGPDWILHQ